MSIRKCSRLNSRRSTLRQGCVLCLLVCAQAAADNHTWGPVPIDSNWDNFLNWSDGTVFTYPSGTGDTATIAQVSTSSPSPKLNVNETLGALTINDGASFSVSNHTLVVNAGTHSGATNVYGTLSVPAGGILDTDFLTIHNDAFVASFGRLQVDRKANIRQDGRFFGSGTLEITGSDDFVNDGRITQDFGDLTITSLGGSAEFDWDGNGINGAAITLSGRLNHKLIIDMPINEAGADGFNGTIYVGFSNVFQVNHPWALGGGTGDPGHLMIRSGNVVGEAFTIHADAEVAGNGVISIVPTATNNLVNNGTISADSNTLVINRLGGTSEFDWDGSGNQGAALNVTNGATMQIDMPIHGGGTDGFNGTITVDQGWLTVNQPWMLGGGFGDAGILQLRDGVISGTGQLTVDDAQSQINVSSVSGEIASDLTFNTGVLNVAAGTHLSLTGTSTFGTASHLNFNGGGSKLTVNQTVEVSGQVHSSEGLIKTGVGTLTLSAANGYTGGTIVEAGTLSVDNTTGSATGRDLVTVLSHAQLGGSGTIEGPVSVAGTLDPGLGVGRLTVGKLTLQPSARTTLEIGDVVAGNDQVLVNTSATLDGTLDVVLAPTYMEPTAPGDIDEFLLIDAADLFGEFQTILYDGAPMELGYLPDHSSGDGFFRQLVDDGSQLKLVNYLALPGDANGDGIVDGLDFVIWNNHKFTSNNDWLSGDFNGDGTTDGRDFIIWNNHKFTSVGQPAAVPEPAWGAMLVASCLFVTSRWRGRCEWDRCECRF